MVDVEGFILILEHDMHEDVPAMWADHLVALPVAPLTVDPLHKGIIKLCGVRSQINPSRSTAAHRASGRRASGRLV